MTKPLTRAAALQNRAFLEALRRTGNVRLACRELGLKYGTMQHRRARHPAFALAWDAALAFAQARFNAAGRLGPRFELTITPFRGNDGAGRGGGYRTLGGEPVVVRRRDGKPQMRAAQPGKLTRESEQAFLAALSATANVRLAAAAIGASAGAFYRRRRQNPAFAREMRMALEMGYDRLEAALLESGLAGAHEHDAWRGNEPPAIPPMTASQALQLMYLHQKQARLLAEPDHIRPRRGESEEAHCLRLTAMYEARLERDRERFEVAEAERRAQTERARPGPRFRGDDGAGPLLPDLAQVTGWSRADRDKAPHDPARALFGGWRLEDMEKEQGR